MENIPLHGPCILMSSDIGVYIFSAASLTAAEKAKLGNWAMQPIVAKYTNKAVPIFQIRLSGARLSIEGRIWLYKELIDIGDPADVYLGEALYLITGDINYKPVPVSAR